MRKARWFQAGAVLLSLYAVALSFGQTTPSATVSWLAPTQYTDGTAIAAGELDHYTLTWVGTTAGGPSGSLSVPASALSSVVPFACGQANFAISVTTSATAKYPNATSALTSLVLFDSQVKCVPNPPSGVAVQSSGVKPK